MRHQAKGRQLSRTAEHRRLLSNMATSLFLHGKVVRPSQELRPCGEAHHARLARRSPRAAWCPTRSAGAARCRLFTEIGPASRRPALHPHPQAGSSPRRRSRCRPDRAAVRVRRRADLEMKGDAGSPFWSVRAAARELLPPSWLS
jgi:ribosomal protein L17